MHCRYVMAFVNHHVAVGADEVMQVTATRECLDHRDIDSVGQAPPASAEPPDRLRRDVEELAEPFDPLFDQRFAVDEDKRGALAAGDEVCREHGLAPARGCAQDADVMLKECAGSGVLRVVELAGEFDLDLLAVNTLVA